MRLSLENENIFRSENGFTLYESGPNDVVQIRCPHCNCVGTFASAIRHYLGYSKALKHSPASRAAFFGANIRICPNKECRGLVFSIEHSANGRDQTVCFPPELLDFNSENIPPSLTRTLREALTCHANGAYRASAMMVRRLLEELCHEAGVEATNLHSRLKELRSQITLPEELFDAMDELKALGNDAAHIEAKAFGTIDKEESELSIELAQEILKARFQHKSLVSRLRARKSQL